MLSVNKSDFQHFTEKLRTFSCSYSGSHRIRHFVFCYSTNQWNLERRDCVCLYSSRWKRHHAHYLTGFSWWRVSVSILLLCFLSGKRSMKTENGVYTVQFPASHVTWCSDFTGQKDVKQVHVIISKYMWTLDLISPIIRRWQYNSWLLDRFSSHFISAVKTWGDTTNSS